MRESGRELLGKLSISLFHKTPRFIALCPKPPKCPPKKDKEMKKIPQKQTNPNSGLLNLKGAPPFFSPNSKAPQLHLSLEKEAGKKKSLKIPHRRLNYQAQRLYRGKEQRRHEQAESRHSGVPRRSRERGLVGGLAALGREEIVLAIDSQLREQDGAGAVRLVSHWLVGPS
jgi:hypothetical protein